VPSGDKLREGYWRRLHGAIPFLTILRILIKSTGGFEDPLLRILTKLKNTGTQTFGLSVDLLTYRSRPASPSCLSALSAVTSTFSASSPRKACLPTLASIDRRAKI
jgi:hypothetical protein